MKNSRASTAATNNVGFIIWISCVATIGGFLFGFDSGVINGTVDGLKQAFNSNSVGSGFNVASMLLGCAFGALFAGNLADVFGRKTLLVASSILFIISAWGSGIANSSSTFVVFRIIGGLAVGAASVMAPAYISEVSAAHYRGRLTTVQQVAIISGLFFAFLSNYWLADIAQSAVNTLWWNYEAWRWMFWIELAPAFIFFFTLLLIPESPRYLVAKGKDDAAMKVLGKLYGDDTHEKIHEIRASLADDHRPRFSDIFKRDSFRVRPIIWVGIGLAVFQQLVGINVVFYYGAVLWQSVGFSESDALLINVIGGAVSIAACLITISFVDKIGRKPLLLIGSIGMAMTLALLALMFNTGVVDSGGDLRLGTNQGIIALVSANAFVFFFNVSWGPVMWVMLGEMFPNQIRGSGLAIAGLFQWTANFGITMTFPIFLASIGLAGAYSFYALSAAVSVIFVWKCVHETKGLELEEMQG